MATPSKTEGDTLLPDASLLKESLEQLGDASLDVAETACETFCNTLDKYLQLSTLLDPILPELIPPLCALADERLSTFASDPSSHSKWTACRFALLPFIALYAAAKVRGIKPLSRHLPHQVRDLQSTVRQIAFVETACNPHRFWQARYILFAWAAVAVQVPFPLRTILHHPQLSAAIGYARAALQQSGPVSAAAASFLARLASRRDAGEQRAELLDWAVGSTLAKKDEESTRIAGLSLLAAAFKLAHREDLRPHVRPVREALRPLIEEIEGSATTREAHLVTKLAGRLALAVLSPRIAPWRYSRGSRVVFAREGTCVARRHGHGKAGHVGDVEDVGKEEETIDDEAAETLEAVVEVLLTGLQHDDTVVRWSAAKGVGRVTGRLPLPLAQDVVDSVIDLFGHIGEARADAAWHGGCLALAELARRGLLLPREPQFAMTFGVIAKAAGFDIRRGANSVGAHVRDAACYAVWAMARAYSKEDVAPFARSITDCMLPVALLDREINCRRAAAAALQECIGRLSESLFRDGIQLVTIADYFSLGDRVASYLTIAPKVASIAGGEHFDCILLELSNRKLAHWDPAIRTLASQGLAALNAVDDGNVIAKRVVPELLRLSKEKGDMVVRHGAVLGLAEIAMVIGASGLSEVTAEIRGLPRVLKERKMFSGRTGDEMRIACCHLIEDLARGAGDLYVSSVAGREDAEYALEFLESIFGSGKENMYTKATSAYAAICNDVIANDVEWHVNVTKRILRGLSKGGVFIYQRGFALAAGVCGDSAIAEDVAIVLCRETSGNADVEVRRNSAISLSRIPRRVLLERALDIFAALAEGMKDYATDERGDVGSWVREASMRSLSYIVESLFGASAGSSRAPFGSETDTALVRLLRCIVQQCCGRIDRTRTVAGSSLTTFCNVFAGQEDNFTVTPVCKAVGACFAIPHGEEGNGDKPRTVNFGETESVFPAVRAALDIDEVSEAVLVGLVSAGGGMGHQSKAALNSLVVYFQNASDVNLKRKRLCSIVQILESGPERLIVPTLTVLEALVTQKALQAISQSELISLAQTVRASWRQKLRNVRRTVAAVHLLGELAGLSLTGFCFDFREGSLGRECLEALVVVLGGSIPRLRRITAECIYMVLVDYAGDDDNCFDEEERAYIRNECPTIHDALDVLLDTEWEYSTTLAAREQRNLLCKLLKIKAPVPAQLHTAEKTKPCVSS